MRLARLNYSAIVYSEIIWKRRKVQEYNRRWRYIDDHYREGYFAEA